MTHEKFARFRKLFELERENLVQSHGRLAAEFQMAPEDLKDETDFTTSSLEQSMRIRLRNREALYLKKIEEEKKARRKEIQDNIQKYYE